MSDFNAGAHLIKLRGKGGVSDYLPVAARIAWFRADHPEGHIAVEAHTISEQIAIFHARVSIPEGGSAEGWGSETPKDFGDYIEKASTKALGRALLALGYGTLQAGDELDEAERIVDAPIPARQSRDSAPPVPRPTDRAAASPAAAATPLTAEAFTAVMQTAQRMRATGSSYEAIVSHMRSFRDRMTPDQYEDSKTEMQMIKRAMAPVPAGFAG